MTLEGAQDRIWCSEFSWQTVPCSWSIVGEAALIGIQGAPWSWKVMEFRNTIFQA